MRTAYIAEQQKRNNPASFLYILHPDKNKSLTTLQLVQFQNFCYTETTESTRINWVKHFLKSRHIPLTIPTNPKTALIQLGPACHLLDSQYSIETINSEKIIEKIKNHLIPKNDENFKKTSIKNNDLRTPFSEKTKNADLSTGIKNQEKFTKKQIEVGERLDLLIDGFVSGRVKKLVLPEGISSGDIIPSEWEKFHHELVLAMKNPYSDQHEAYSNLNKTQIKKLLEFIKGILLYVKENPIVVIPKKASKKKRIDVFKHFKPMTEWNGLSGITQGKEVIQAKAILLFDTKNTKLGLIYPEGEFEIHRKFIKNIDDDKSLFKRVGIKSADAIKPYLTGTLAGVRNKLDQVKRVNCNFSGLCSDSIIILRRFI